MINFFVASFVPLKMDRFGIFVPPSRQSSFGVIQSNLVELPSISFTGADEPPRPFVSDPFFMRPGFRFKPVVTLPEGEGGPGRRLRKNLSNIRRHIDYIPTILTQITNSQWQRDHRDRPVSQTDVLYTSGGLPAIAYKERPMDCVLSKFVRAAMNKVKCPIYDVCWTPEGKRLITGCSTGEFTLWNGTAFNFETILQAHDTSIHALQWAHNGQWLVSADHDGFIKYWQQNMNNIHMYQAHKEAVRSVSFSPTDTKMVSGSDDGTVRIWDFNTCVEERSCRGHGSDVKAVVWHPSKGLVASGSRDSQQPVKLWNPKTGECLATLRGHKNSVTSVEWNQNGNWLLTGSRDHLIKIFDIRIMKELYTYRVHKKEVTSLAWHPIHEGLFVSGGNDGSMAYWSVNNTKELAFLEHAHDQAIWTLKWHPRGHILASGSNDNNTKFWSRNRPGDILEDFFEVTGGKPTGKAVETAAEKAARNAVEESLITATFRPDTIPGMGIEGEELEQMKHSAGDRVGVGGPTLFHGNPCPSNTLCSREIGAKRTLIKQPPPKKAQRQLERLWNSIGPMGTGDSDSVEASNSARMSSSLLDPRPLKAESEQKRIRLEQHKPARIEDEDLRRKEETHRRHAPLLAEEPRVALLPHSGQTGEGQFGSNVIGQSNQFLAGRKQLFLPPSFTNGGYSNMPTECFGAHAFSFPQATGMFLGPPPIPPPGPPPPFEELIRQTRFPTNATNVQ